jgi:hypothetical protein
VFTAARLRLGKAITRCEACASYEVIGGVCRSCDWTDESYEPAATEEWSEAEKARRLAEPCTPSSNISTFLGPDEFS